MRTRKTPTAAVRRANRRSAGRARRQLALGDGAVPASDRIAVRAGAPTTRSPAVQRRRRHRPAGRHAGPASRCARRGPIRARHARRARRDGPPASEGGDPGQGAADQQLLDLAGALVQRRDPRVAQVLRRRGTRRRSRSRRAPGCSCSPPAPTPRSRTASPSTPPASSARRGSSGRPPRQVSSRAASTSTAVSAISSCTSWWPAIGLPNCSRSVA